MSEKLWAGRFREKTDRGVEAFTSSIQYDRRLYAWDIEGSIAHCRMLAGTGVIKEEEADRMAAGLTRIKGEIRDGNFEFTDRLEDIHMHIESRLQELIGDTAARLHTGRSRNDQVALDIRMYLRDAVHHIITRLQSLRSVLVELSRAHLDVVMPGYTHTQRAQPVLFSHHLMAYYEMFTRDQDRFNDSLKRINVMPLGAAALAGTTYPIDPEDVAARLDFPRIAGNSIDAVSDRDFIIEFLADASLCMVHMSRFSEELILWSTSEFNFIELSDAFTTGSSIMPQKKNPDIPELVRGKAGRVFGDLMALLTLMKGLPLSYNRDMQEDKTALFNSVDIVSACLDIYIGMLPAMRVNQDRMRAATTTGYLNATDLADYLVSKGIPFRKAHAITGRAVAAALKQNKELHELSLAALQAFSPLIESDVYRFLEVDSMVNRRLSPGGTALENVKNAIRTAEKRLRKT
ncbi:MAG: argininosuccinate lyase [Deltaproteobacteria bacterium]|nr:MAG: argininosuccinate lyase [Deltaproteobacteria bacterium]